MTTKDLALADFDREMESTRRFLERVPDDKLAWQPHEKSMALGRLAMHLAELPKGALVVINEDGYEYAGPGGPPPAGGRPTRAPKRSRPSTPTSRRRERRCPG
jgi:hypothetical protein